MFFWFKNGQLIWNWQKIVTEIRCLQKLLHSLPQGADRIGVHNKVSEPGSYPVTCVLRNGFSNSSLRDSTSESNSLSLNISSPHSRILTPSHIAALQPISFGCGSILSTTVNNHNLLHPLSLSPATSPLCCSFYLLLSWPVTLFHFYSHTNRPVPSFAYSQTYKRCLNSRIPSFGFI